MFMYLVYDFKKLLNISGVLAAEDSGLAKNFDNDEKGKNVDIWIVKYNPIDYLKTHYLQPLSKIAQKLFKKFYHPSKDRWDIFLSWIKPQKVTKGRETVLSNQANVD